jgi:hypothetical protein
MYSDYVDICEGRCAAAAAVKYGAQPPFEVQVDRHKD